MKTRAILIIAPLLVALNAPAAATNDVAIPPDLSEQVLTHHLKIHPPRGPFGLVQRIDWKKHEFVDLPADVLDRILRRTVGGKRLFVPSAELRLPAEDERDPSDPNGGRWRGIERKNGGYRVYVLYISKIEPKGGGVFEVYYSNYNGPLAAGGGSYIATQTETGWKIERSEKNWVS